MSMLAFFPRKLPINDEAADPVSELFDPLGLPLFKGADIVIGEVSLIGKEKKSVVVDSSESLFSRSRT